MRSGFTLPELLVAAAVSMVIMAIIAVAFQKAIDSFRTLRAVALMQDKLRSAENVLRRDLSAQHFGGQFQEGLSGPSVRDQRLDLFGWMPPDQGYFELFAPPGIVEGHDMDGLPSTIAHNHWMRFTVQLTGKRQEDWFYASAPAGSGLPGNVMTAPPNDPNFGSAAAVASRWAEICYFLHPNGDHANGNPLFALYRRQRVILPTAVAGTYSEHQYPDLSTSPPVPAKSTDPRPVGYTFNTPASVTMRANRIFGTTPTLAPLTSVTDHERGDDILLTDVLSFEIRAHWMTGTQTPLNAPQFHFPAPQRNHDYPFSAVTFQTHRFDTGSVGDSNSLAPVVDWNNPVSFLRQTPLLPHNRVRLDSLQIHIRIWDFHTQTARQVTIIQDI